MGRMKDLEIEMDEDGDGRRMNDDSDALYERMVEDSIASLHEEIQAVAKKAIASSGFYKGRPRKVWSSIASQAMHEASVAEEREEVKK